MEGPLICFRHAYSSLKIRKRRNRRELRRRLSDYNGFGG